MHIIEIEENKEHALFDHDLVLFITRICRII